LLARLSQVVRTLTAVGAKRVQLLIDGAKVPDVFPGVPTASPVTFGFLQTPNVPVPKPRPGRREAFDKHVKAVQTRLIVLGYLPAGSADGRFGPVTQEGILALQKLERTQRTGTLDPSTEARLQTASHPTARTRGPRGKRAEILIDRQVALLIVDNKVVRTIAVSTGKPFDSDASGELSGVRQDHSLVVGAVSRVASMGGAVRRGHRLSRVSGRADVSSLARLRPPVVHGGTPDLRLRGRRDARAGDRQVTRIGKFNRKESLEWQRRRHASSEHVSTSTSNRATSSSDS
jgi:Putative peptidoglycan binding domain